MIARGLPEELRRVAAERDQARQEAAGLRAELQAAHAVLDGARAPTGRTVAGRIAGLLVDRPARPDPAVDDHTLPHT